MKFKFIGVPGERHESLNMFGVVFPLGEAVEIEGKGAEKLKSHPHFEAVEDGGHAGGADVTSEESAAEPVKRGPGRPKKS